MPQIDLIIFDLDGTLIDSRKDIAHCVNHVLDDMGLPAIDHETIYSHVGHGVRDLMKGAIHAAHGDEVEAAYERALQLFDHHYTDKLLVHTDLFPGMREILQRYRDKPMAVITNKPQKYTDMIIQGLELNEYFRPVLGREACPNPKPHPEPVQKVLAAHDIPQERAIIIGDTEVDIQAGKSAGILTCGVLFGFGKPEIVKAAEPDFLVEEVGELMGLFL